MILNLINKYNLLIFDTVNSTNLVAKELIKSPLSIDHIILANNQTSGIGQNNKKWQSLKGNLNMTILLHIEDRHKNFIQQLPFLMAIILYDTIISLIYINKANLLLDKLKIKWPNDILINNKKVAGILLQSIQIKNHQYIIIGVGVNVINCTQNTVYLSTSLCNEGINLPNYNKLFDILINKFDQLYSHWYNSSNYNSLFLEIRKKWLKNCYNLQDYIVININKKRFAAILKSITNQGEIIVELEDNKIYIFSYGEII